MKKFLLSSIVFIASIGSAFSISYVSAGAGPVNWNVASSWTPSGIPGLNDDVTISSGHTITVNSLRYVRNLTVDGSLSMLSGGGINVKGDYTVNGTESGTGSIYFITNTKTVSGTGTFSPTMIWQFKVNTTIDATVSIFKTAKTYITAGVIVTNNGTIGVQQMVLSAGATWIQGPNSNLTTSVSNTFFAGTYASIGTFDASATGNTVTHSIFGGTLPNTVSGYFNLILTNGGTKLMGANTTVHGNLTLTRTGTSLMNFKPNGFDLTVEGNITKTNGAYFTGSTGKNLFLSGTSLQTLSNTGVAYDFTCLTINNPSGVILSSGLYSLSEVLTLTDGILNTNGKTFTMLSTATKTARIAPITGTGAVSGNFTIQRFISARDTTFADLASPVQNSTFLDWDNELPAISYLPASSGTTQGSASTYDETADAYVAVTSSSTPLTPGQGFEVFLTGDFSYTNFPATTLTTVGVPTQGDQDLSSLVSANVQGWNLVGNPFASSISWASVYASSGGAASGLFDYIEMYDYTIGDWADVTADDEIASTQGFWVYSDFSATPTLFVLESSKINATVHDIRASKKAAPYFTLKLASTENSYAHNFKVIASTDASDGVDRKDIPFRNSPNKATPAMYTMVDGKRINTNTFNVSNETYSIALKTQVTVNGSYKITASGFEYISDYTCIKLQDKLTGQIVDLNEGNGYCFNMNVNDSPDRFILLLNKDNNNCKSFVAAPASTYDFSNEVEILPTSQGNLVNFNFGETTNTTISVVNVLGQTIVEGTTVNATTQSVNIALPQDFSGLYFIKVESAKGAVTKKFVRK
ncbi:MAG: T9SS type A sorting domain-containing protein [Bacteroidetes bacterium]|nr:T9SS type A sorting domain-containing protein [Bacteroidota bacterium]